MLESFFPMSLYVGLCDFVVVVFRSKELQGEAGDLRERIKHLNDMVFCQQRKVKGMIEEVSKIYLCACRWSHGFSSTVLPVLTV